MLDRYLKEIPCARRNINYFFSSRFNSDYLSSSNVFFQLFQSVIFHFVERVVNR